MNQTFRLNKRFILGWLSLFLRSSLKPVLLLTAMMLIFVNCFYYFVFIMQKIAHHVEWVEPGAQFENFLPHLDGVEEIGYLTDKTLHRESNDGFYLQSQYYLAPLLVKKGYHGDQFNIIDSENIEFIRRSFIETQSERVTHNPYGQALMKRRTLP